MRRRLHVETDDVPHFLDQQRIGRQLERLGPMRLQTKGAPDLLNRRAPQAARLGHTATAPVRLAPRRLFERPHDHLLHLRVSHPARRTGARLVIQPVQARANEPAAPFADGHLRHPQPPGHNPVVDAFGTRQNDPGTTRQLRRRARAMGQRVELHAFVGRENQRHLGPSHTRLLVDEYDQAATVISQSSRSGH
jgi:hypothetical protein